MKHFINFVFKKKSNTAACFTRGRSARDHNLPQEQFGSIKKQSEKNMSTHYIACTKGNEFRETQIR